MKPIIQTGRNQLRICHEVIYANIDAGSTKAIATRRPGLHHRDETNFARRDEFLTRHKSVEKEDLLREKVVGKHSY